MNNSDKPHSSGRHPSHAARSGASSHRIAGWAAALILGGALIFGYSSCSSSSAISSSTSEADVLRAQASVLERQAGMSNTTGAWAYMQQFVAQRLKSPGSADFPFGGHRDVVPLGDDRYHIKSYVEAKNSFGVTIRKDFEGTVRETETGWELEELTIAE